MALFGISDNIAVANPSNDALMNKLSEPFKGMKASVLRKVETNMPVAENLAMDVEQSLYSRKVTFFDKLKSYITIVACTVILKLGLYSDVREKKDHEQSIKEAKRQLKRFNSKEAALNAKASMQRIGHDFKNGDVKGIGKHAFHGIKSGLNAVKYQVEVLKP